MALHTHPVAVAAALAALVVPAVAHAAPTEEDWAVGVQVGVYESPWLRLPTGAIGLHVRRVIVPRISGGLSYAHLVSDAYYDKCRSDDCPTNIEVLRAFGELHLLPASPADALAKLVSAIAAVHRRR